MSKHSVDNFQPMFITNEDLVRVAKLAAVYAQVGGSHEGKYVEQDATNLLWGKYPAEVHATVERIDGSSAWRVISYGNFGSNNFDIDPPVYVLRGAEGRFSTHSKKEEVA